MPGNLRAEAQATPRPFATRASLRTPVAPRSLQLPNPISTRPAILSRTGRPWGDRREQGLRDTRDPSRLITDFANLVAITSFEARSADSHEVSQIGQRLGLSGGAFRTRARPPVLAFVLDRWSVPDRAVQPAVVKPAHVVDGRELELRVGAPGPV